MKEELMKQALIPLILWATCGSAATAPAGQGATQRDTAASKPSIYKLEELTWPQIDALDRQRTLFILPVGMIEQHGPHLPVGADTIGVRYEANAASTRVAGPDSTGWPGTSTLKQAAEKGRLWIRVCIARAPTAKRGSRCAVI